MKKKKINKVNRPPLTKKALAAIRVYVDLKSPEGRGRKCVPVVEDDDLHVRAAFLREEGIDCVL